MSFHAPRGLGGRSLGGARLGARRRSVGGGGEELTEWSWLVSVPNVFTHQGLSNRTLFNSAGLLQYVPHQLLENANLNDVTGNIPSGWFQDFATGTVTFADQGGFQRATYAGTAQRPFNGNNIAVEDGATYTVGAYIVSSSASAVIISGVSTSGTDGDISDSDFTTEGWYGVGILMGDTQVQLRMGLGAGGSDTGTIVIERPFIIKGLLPGVGVNSPAKLSGEPLGEWISTDDGDEPLYTTRVASHVYNGSSWLNEGYLGEEARTNLCLQSDDLTTTWTLPGANTTVTANAGVALTGLTTADDVKHLDSAETVQQTVTVGSNVITCLSAVVEQGTTGSHDFVKISVIDNSDGANGYEAWFNIATGAAGTAQADGTGTLTKSGIIDMKDGKYRIYVSGKITTGQTDGRIELINTTADAVDTAEATNSVYWSSLQLEAGQSPSSIIPTVLSTVERTADSMLYGVSGTILNEINFEAGTIVVEGMANPGSLADGTTRRMFEAASDALTSDNPKLQMVVDASTSGTATFNSVLAGSTKTWNPTTSNTDATRHSYGVSWDSSGGLSSFDGVTGATEPAFTPEVGFDKIGIGSDFAGTNGFMGHIRTVIITKAKDPQAALNARTA